jgi:hypothetical protein
MTLSIVTSGIAMLKCKNWGRYLYSIWSVVSTAYSLVLAPFKAVQILNIAVLAVIIFFLFRPKVSEYFSGAGAHQNAQSS